MARHGHRYSQISAQAAVDGLAYICGFHEPNQGFASAAAAVHTHVFHEASSGAHALVISAFPWMDHSTISRVFCSCMLRLKPHREHCELRAAVLALCYRVEGTALNAVTRPVFMLWRLASKVHFKRRCSLSRSTSHRQNTAGDSSVFP